MNPYDLTNEDWHIWLLRSPARARAFPLSMASGRRDADAMTNWLAWRARHGYRSALLIREILEAELEIC